MKSFNLKRIISFLGLVLLGIIYVGCNQEDTNDSVQKRTFLMGVTPWPADFTVAEVDTAYAFINSHCDLVSHHFDDGIPYQEAFTQQNYPIDFVNDVNYRKSKTNAQNKILLSVSALNLTRIHKADYYKNSTVAQSIKTQWESLPINHPNVVVAYVNYMNYLINSFQPDYINYGVESNSLQFTTAEFSLYKDFIAQVFAQLKAQHPTIPLFVSFMVDESSEGFQNAQQLLPYTDIIGLSAYPYITISSSNSGNTNPDIFPANYFERFITMANKPFAFAETGYLAENLNIPSYNLNKLGTAAWQNAYLKKILELCQDNHAEFCVWFCSKDYDAATQTMINMGVYMDLFGFWKDTGFKDQWGQKRPSYQTWLDWMAKEKN